MTNEQMDELVAYLPMLRRLASYEAGAESSIPEQLSAVQHFLGAVGHLFEKGAHLDNPQLAEAYRRREDEALPERARLHWRQIPGVEDEMTAAAEAGDDEALAAARVRAMAQAELNASIARVP